MSVVSLYLYLLCVCERMLFVVRQLFKERFYYKESITNFV